MRAKTEFFLPSLRPSVATMAGSLPDCGGWNTMKEERQAPTGKGRPAAMKMAQAKGHADCRHRSGR